MEILAWIMYGIACFIAIGWVYGIRHNTNSGEGVSMQTVNSTLLFLVSLGLVPILGISPFHIIWMFLVSLFLGSFSLAFPFSLLSIFGKILATVVCLGLHQRSDIGKEG